MSSIGKKTIGRMTVDSNKIIGVGIFSLWIMFILFLIAIAIIFVSVAFPTEPQIPLSMRDCMNQCVVSLPYNMLRENIDVRGFCEIACQEFKPCQ